MYRIVSACVLFLAFFASCSSGGGNTSEPEADIIYNEIIPVADTGTKLSPGWWKNAVFYECYVRSFKDSNSDGIGDIKGLISKLDYVRDLGVTAIWLMPIAQSAVHFNGYDVKDYRSVESDYGTMADFQLLLDEVHNRGMALIIDFVPNHTADTHPFFVNSANNGGYRDWYIWSKTNPAWPHPWTPPVIVPGEEPKTTPVWFERNGRYYYSHFMESLPELNFKNPSVVAYTRDTAKFWLNLGVDGFRIDACQALVENGPYAQVDQPETHQFFRNLRSLVNQYDNRFIISEAPFTRTAYLGSGTDEFNSGFAFEYSSNMMNSIEYEDAQALQAFCAFADNAPAGSMLATMQSNHDPFVGGRPFTRFGGDLQKCKLSASVLLTSPGIPFIYYGEELAMKRYEDDDWKLWDDERIRTPMQWDGSSNAGFTTALAPNIQVNKDYGIYNVQTESADPGSILNHYRKMTAIRKNNPALSTGTCEPAAPSDFVASAAWVMSSGDSRVLVVANVSGTEITETVDLTSTGLAMSDNHAAAGMDLYSNMITFGDINAANYTAYQVTVPAYGILILPFSVNTNQLILNSGFDMPITGHIPTGWQRYWPTQTEPPDFQLPSYDGHSGVLKFTQDTAGLGITQNVPVTAPALNRKLSFTFKIVSAALSGDGTIALCNEAPLYVVLTFKDAAGTSHVFKRYYNYANDNNSAANPVFELVTKNTWVTKIYSLEAMNVDPAWLLESASVLSTGGAREAYVDSISFE